jgi:hypothetical protein
VGVDAGFAVAITLRENLLNDAALIAYAGGTFPRSLDTSKFPPDYQLPGWPPRADLKMFLGPPIINCHTNNTLSIALHMWGQLSVTMNAENAFVDVEEGATVDAQLLVRLVPTFVKVGSELVLRPDNVTVQQWDYTVISPGGFSPAADSYLRSSAFRSRLQTTIGLAIDADVVSLPKIDISFLGSGLTAVAMTAVSRARQGVVLIGFNIESEDVTLVGNVEDLSDFADSNDLAAVTNADAVEILLQKVVQETREKVSEQGATLEDLNIKAGDGRFLIWGKASKTSGSTGFSFALIPTYYATRGPKLFQYVGRPVWVNSRSWPALGFAVVDVKVGVALAAWLHLIHFFSKYTIAHFIALEIEDMVRHTIAEVTDAIEGTDTVTPVPRVRRLKPKRPGGATVRVEIAEYRITKQGTYIGIKVAPESLPGALIGLTSIPANLRTQEVRYAVRLPLGVGTDDPALRIRWTVINPGTGHVLITEDGLAADRLMFGFVPEVAGPGLAYLRVAVRVYRPLGPQIMDFVNDGITLEIGDPLPPGAYVRWWYPAKNPQVHFDEHTDDYVYLGEAVVWRHSNIHRTDRPCAMADKRSRYAYPIEILDALPFPISEIVSHRPQLCDYCFYGGPAGMRPSL